MSTNKVEAAATAIAAHTKAADIDDEGSAELGLWHLLASLREFAQAKNIDFDEQLADVKANEGDWI